MSTPHPDLEHFRADLRHAVEADLVRQKARRRSRTRVVGVGVPGFAVALGLSLTFVLAGSPAAFAGWSPSPTAAPATQTSAAEATCRAQLAATPSTWAGVAPGSWHEVATDVRGPFTLVVFHNGSNGATCLTGPSITVISQSTAGGHFLSVSGSASRTGRASSGGRGSVTNISSAFSGGSSGRVNHLTLTHLTSDGQGHFTVVEGQIDQSVTGLTFVLSHGEHVQATTGNGWLLAWWPGSLDATSADITTATGSSSQALSPNGPGQGGPGQGGHGSSRTITGVSGTGNS